MAETPDPAAPAAPSETPNPEAPSPNVTPPAAPPAQAPPAPAPQANAVDPAEVERLRKQTEQKDLRIRQLENQEAARAKAEEEAKAKELEATSQYKTLYETEKAEREKLEADQAAKEKATQLKAEADKVFSTYSPEVRKLAETTGLSLSDSDETTVTAFKAKLDEIKTMVGGAKVTPNNPGSPTPRGPSVEDDDGLIKQEISGEKFDSLIAQMPGIASMMGPKPEP